MFDTRQPGADPGIAILAPDPGTTAPGPDLDREGSRAAAAAPGQACAPSPPDPVPLERLEAQICELAGHLTAATCRFLVLLADFDARRGWASWEMNSCAQAGSRAVSPAGSTCTTSSTGATAGAPS
jgi:hypothetical protein